MVDDGHETGCQAGRTAAYPQPTAAAEVPSLDRRMPLLKGLRVAAVNVVKHLLKPRPQRSVSLRWLIWPSSSGVKRRFRATATVTCQEDGDLRIVTVNGQKFVWPRDASMRQLYILCAELMVPNHPHQYLWGPTKISPGETVLDIGACEGGFSARATEIGADVIAVEPSGKMIGVMRRLFEVRGLREPTIRQCLLGGRCGETLFLDDEYEPAFSAAVSEPTNGAHTLPMLTLDELVESTGIERLDFIKCDAEGAEEAILRGGEQTLRRFRPKLAFCAYETDHQFMDMYRFLHGLGYRIKGKGLRCLESDLRIVMLHAW